MHLPVTIKIYFPLPPLACFHSCTTCCGARGRIILPVVSVKKIPCIDKGNRISLRYMEKEVLKVVFSGETCVLYNGKIYSRYVMNIHCKAKVNIYKVSLEPKI